MRKLVLVFVFTIVMAACLAACGTQKDAVAQTKKTPFTIENPIFAFDQTFDDYADCHDEVARNRQTLVVDHSLFYDGMFLEFPGSTSISWTDESQKEGEKIYIVFYRAEPSETEIDNNSLLYRPDSYVTLEQVKTDFPIDQEAGYDFRYVPFFAATEELKDAMNSSWSEDQAHHYVDLLFHLKTRFCIAGGG